MHIKCIKYIIYIYIYNIQFYTNLLRTENEMKSVETKYN